MSKQAAEMLAAFGAAAARVLAQITGQPWSAIATDAAEPADGETMPFVAERAVHGGLRVVIATEHARVAAQVFTAGALTGDAYDADHREAVQEWLRQCAGEMTVALRPQYGDFSLRHVEAANAAFDSAEEGAIALSPGPEGATIVLRLALDREFASCVSEAQNAPTPPELPDQAASHAPLPDAEATPANLDLLMEVELPVMLCFGTREMLLREVLELDAGAVVELDQQVQEPVDLLLDGRVIARGEVVVVDGSYGLRVTEVAAPQQRVRSMANCL